jgi:hypothetical protein
MSPISLAGVAAEAAPRKSTPTDEQLAAIDVFKTGDALVLEAGAGTGKTTTLRHMANATGRRGIYVAYNRAIAQDAKASFPQSAKCATAHSYAFQAVGKQFAHRLRGGRVPAWKAAAFLGAEALDVGPGRNIRRNAVARAALDTVAAYCNSADREIGPQHVPWVDGVEYVHEFQQEIVRLARKAWHDDLSRRDGGQLRFTHDCYLKIWALGNPTLDGDYILLDEAQDANPVIADVVLRQDAQLIAVGDRCQAIYAWRGAVDAMSDWPAEHRLPLTQSFRFGPAVAERANVWLKLLGSELRLRGFDEIPSQVMPLSDPAAVLCRTNAEAVAQALAALSDDRRPAIVGGVEQIRAIANAAADLKNGVGTDHRDLCAFKTWAEVQDYVLEDSAAADLRVLVQLVDAYGVAKILEVTDACVDEAYASVIVSTAHKAKGREFPSVKIATDFRPPKDGEEVERSEGMLAYVAVTRAKNALDDDALSWVRSARVARPATSSGPDHAQSQASPNAASPLTNWRAPGFTPSPGAPNLSSADRLAANDADGVRLGRSTGR